MQKWTTLALLPAVFEARCNFSEPMHTCKAAFYSGAGVRVTRLMCPKRL